jgi:2-dehydro-3-deoxygluconokinase
VSVLGAIGEGLVELGVESSNAGVELGFGGDAANICVMASRAGASTRLAGRVGDDALGRSLVAFWRSAGVDLRSLRQDDGAATGLYVNESGPGGHRFVYWRSGSAGSRLAPGDLDDEFFADLGVLVVTGVSLAISSSAAAACHHAIAEARRREIPIACVLNHRPALGGDVVELAGVARASETVIASTEDAEAVFGSSDPATLAEALGAVPQEVVLTSGPGGASVSTPSGTRTQAVPAVPVRNAAGAGDALAGAYLALRLGGRPAVTALRWGVAAASLSVQRDGCAASYPSAAETAARARELQAADPAPAGGVAG